MSLHSHGVSARLCKRKRPSGYPRSAWAPASPSLRWGTAVGPPTFLGDMRSTAACIQITGPICRCTHTACARGSGGKNVPQGTPHPSERHEARQLVDRLQVCHFTACAGSEGAKVHRGTHARRRLRRRPRGWLRRRRGRWVRCRRRGTYGGDVKNSHIPRSNKIQGGASPEFSDAHLRASRNIFRRCGE